MNSVLLTVDLTKAVADEAIERKDCVVVSYRRHFLPDLQTTRQHANTPTGGRSDHIQGFKVPYPGRYATTISATSRSRGYKRT